MTRSIIALPVVAAGLIVAGVVVALWMAGSASGERDKFSSLEIAPADTDVFFALNTDPTSPQWLAVNDSLDDINAKTPLREMLDEALAEVNLDWEEDIVPVAGDEAFFSVPDIEAASDGSGFVAGLKVGNQDKAQEVFDDLRSRAAEEGEDFSEEEYEGVTIYYTEAPEIDFDEPFGEDPLEDFDEDALDGPIEIDPILDDPLATPSTTEDPDDINSDALDDLGPFDQEFFDCIPYSLGGDLEGQPLPSECQPYWDCAYFGLAPPGQSKDEDTNGDGLPDACEQFDFFSDDQQGFQIYPGDTDDVQSDPIRIEIEEETAESLEDIQSEPIRITEDEDELASIDTGEDDDATGAFAQDVSAGGAVALFDSVLAIGATPEDVKAVIDVVQGRAESAETNERLQEFRALQSEDFLVWGYADLAPVWDMAESNLDSEALDDVEEATPFDPQELVDEARGTYDRVGFSVSSVDAGFAFDVTVLHAEGFDPEYRFEPSEAFESEFAGKVPASTMLFFAGYDVYGQSVEPALETLNDIDFGDGQTFQDFLDEFSQETGVDIQNDLLAQLTGEWAVAADVSDFEDPQVEAVALVELEDTNTAEQALRDFGSWLEDEGEISTTETSSIHEWSDAYAPDEPGLTWTIVDGDFVGGYPREVIEEAGSGLDDTLAESNDWQRSMELLPGDKTFMGFVSIARILEEARKLPDAEAEFLASTDGNVSLADLEPIRSIGMSGTSRDNGFGFHAVLFMAD